MFGSAVLDTAIGVVFVFFIISTICSNTYTIIARILNTRGKLLNESLEKLLGESAYQRVMNHPLIKDKLRAAGMSGVDFERLPDWIDPDVFAKVLTDIAQEANQATDVSRVLPGQVGDTVIYAIEQLQRGVAQVQEIKSEIKNWYNQRMFDLTEIFKRQSQIWLALIALVITVIFNLNTIAIAEALWHGPTLRDAVVETATQQVDAENIAAEGDERGPVEIFQEELVALNLPVGWTEEELGKFYLPKDLAFATLAPGRNAPGAGKMIIGWGITIGAAMFGAPYWYRLLQNLVDIRSSRK